MITSSTIFWLLFGLSAMLFCEATLALVLMNTFDGISEGNLKEASIAVLFYSFFWIIPTMMMWLVYPAMVEGLP